MAVSAVGVSALIRVPLNALLGSAAPFLFFFPAIMVSGWYGGPGPGLLATALSAAAGVYFYIEPIYSFSIVNPGVAFSLGLFISVGIFIRLVSSRWQVAKQAERLQREYFQVTLSGIGDAVIATDRQGRVTFMNPVAETLTGWSQREASGHPLTEVFNIINEHTRQTVENPVAKVLSEGVIVGLANHTILISKGGKEIPIDDSGAPIRGPGGELIGVVLVFRDISERKRAEVAEHFLAEAGMLLSSSLDYETTLASMARLAVPFVADWCSIHIVEQGQAHPLAVAHVDPGKVNWAKELQRRYPPDPDAPYGVPHVLRTGQPEFAAEIPDSLLEALARDAEHLRILREIGLRSYMIVPLVARDRMLGTITLVTAESGRTFGETDLALAGELARRAALAVDNARLYREAQQAIHERQQALELHRSVEERLALLAQASDTLLSAPTFAEVQPAILTVARRLIDADAYAIWRFQRETGDWRIAIAEGLSEAFWADRIHVSGSMADMPQTPIIVEDVYQEPMLDMRRDMHRVEGIQSLLSLPLKIGGGMSATLTFYYRDAHHFTETEVRVAVALGNMATAALSSAELYEEQSRMRVEAENGARLKDEFLATISHELRTPLNAILGWATMLRGGKLDEQMTARAIETIERNAQSQSKLIEDLLDISRIITGKLRLDVQQVELVPIIQSAIDVVQPAVDAKGVHLQAMLDPDAGPISGDPSRLQQIVWNLLSNAVKFTPMGGRVQIRLERFDSHVEVIVSDTGQGISAEFLPYVFDRFRQADSTLTRKSGGLGLGLAIVQHLTDLHGGSVKALSDGDGRGATFIVRLPFTVARMVGRRATGDLEQEPPGRAGEPMGSLPVLTGLRFLVVEDETDARELIVTMLCQCGAETKAAASSAEALETFREWGPDILVSDIEMPGEDGYSLIKKVRALSAEKGGAIPAIAITAHIRAEDRLRALSAGFDAHVAKPVELSELAGVIVTLASRGKGA